jgi:predicted RNase H-like nuclease
MVKFIGVDLAWGPNAWTGVAVIGHEGELLVVDRLRTDDEIAGRLREHLGGPAIVAIDAPLIVRNKAGRRPCESVVSSLFGRFHAGAHSSNLSLPSFREGPRGGRLAQLLELDVDPAFEPHAEVRRGIEVYPHPATVTLFGLERVIPYKQKPGRTPDQRRVAMLQLVDHLDSLESAVPPLRLRGCAAWNRAVGEIAAATTHAEMNRWEDAVDGVLCAYIGLHRWWYGDERSAVIGDTETGYIVVPVDERVRETARRGGQRRLSNAEVETLAIDIVRRMAESTGWVVEDTRYVASAVGDLVVDGRPLEIKASARSVRGEDLWLEPKQAEALLSGALDLVLVEHVTEDGSGVVRWVGADQLEQLLTRLREQRYFTLPVPVAMYDAIDAVTVEPPGPPVA